MTLLKLTIYYSKISKFHPNFIINIKFFEVKNLIFQLKLDFLVQCEINLNLIREIAVHLLIIVIFNLLNLMGCILFVKAITHKTIKFLITIIFPIIKQFHNFI